MKAVVRNERFSIADPSVYYIFGLIPKNSICRAFLCGAEIETIIEPWEDVNNLEKMDIPDNDDIISVRVSVVIPNEFPETGKLVIFVERDGERLKWVSNDIAKLKKQNKVIQYCIDAVERTDYSSISISGWAVSMQKLTIEARDQMGNLLLGREKRSQRIDVKSVFTEANIDENCGFQFILDKINAKRVNIIFKAGDCVETVSFSMNKGEILLSKLKQDIKKNHTYLKENGLAGFCIKPLKSIRKEDKPVEYSEWIKHNFVTKRQLNKQKKMKFVYEPLISVVVPLYKTPELFLTALVQSLKVQSYSNWELVLSDGSGENSPIENILKSMTNGDKRIKVIAADKPYSISKNTNRAIKHAKGEFIAFADHDDLLAPDALFEVIKALNEDNSLEFIYTDEDKTDETGQTFFEPHMKPDFNIDLLRTNNYICHLSIIKKELLDKIGYLDSLYDGAQDYDLTLRAVENTDKIYHIPRVLYHWRAHVNSTAENPESKLYAFEAGRRAIQAHYNRVGINATVVNGEHLGFYRTKYIRDYDPLISIIIPNKDHTDDLKRCIDSIENKSSYRNYEYIIVENNSELNETFEFYKKLELENKRVKVVYYKGTFNYSLINNFGAEYANGEYYLLLNNDTCLINSDCFEEMLGYCMRKDVGIVGARLYYEDNTIQHAGVVVGFGGVAGHSFVSYPRGAAGYFGRIICAQDYSAVTAACMMVDANAFKEVKGLSDDLAVAFNDVDFCLRVREAGYLVVYNPYAELYHLESKSRGLDDTPEKALRFNSEVDTFEKKWGAFLEKGDPYYSPNLAIDSQPFSLRKNY